MDRYRFTVTTYDRRQLEKCKNILTARLSHNYTELIFTFNQHTHKGRSLSFWVDVTFPPTLDHQSALFRILNVFRTAMASEKMTLSLDTKLPNEHFRCADVDICVREVAFGLVHSPFQFQSVCIVDPMQQRFINLDKFIDNYQQVYRISFFHDRRLCELQMPMFDAMDRQRFQMRMKRKHGGSINIAEAKRIQAYLEAENDPDGCRNELNEVLVRLPYENIKLLIFDMDDVTAKTIKGDLIIIYEHPPMAYIYPLTKSGERAVNYAPRYVRWSKNFSIKDFMEPMVQSSAMKLRVAFEKDVFYSLIAMNKLRLSCDVSFRKFEIPKNNIDLTIKDTKYQYEWPFEIRYLIECILSRGSIGKRAILGSQGNYERVFGQVRKYLYEADGTNRATNYLLDIFFKVLKADLDTEEEEVVRRRFQSNIDDPSYIAIRKAIITPTRILYYPPEPAMGCRLIRRFKADQFLRVVFRDDTMDTLHNLSESLIDETITRLMKNGIQVGGQKFFYLGYSNSQLRDQGCYFYRGNDVSALMKVYNCMGEFKKENVAKTMARFAQCFTQSYASNIELPRTRVTEIPDYANNACDAKGNSYCFSDGVGVMSLTTAKLLQQELGFKTTPSCYQFRYAGYKGVVSVDPYLSEYAEFIEANALTPHETTPFTKDILFRPSQNKFTANDEHSSFEMVKRSAPCAVNLNKQLINIYDQVASTQSQRVHENVTKRILQLTDARITSIMNSLTDEGSFQLVLRELPAFVPYRQLKGFMSLVVEPFFRRLVLAWAKSSFKYLSEKARIPVPPDFGRNMFGIVDETGYLQYGQVFVQYSESIYEHSGNTNAIILKGNVMITKNPMMNGGDLRKFSAIDVPALRHLRDVVVFPQHGPRPAPDEMAGSDLDGDEYSVIWDPELMLEFSAPAMDYSPEPAKAEKLTFEDLLEHASIIGRYCAASDKECHMMTVRAKSIEFFKNYLLNDSIGVVANAHLGNSDLYGRPQHLLQVRLPVIPNPPGMRHLRQPPSCSAKSSPSKSCNPSNTVSMTTAIYVI
uniref:RNA-dependent RNA polymerase n=1 Tax=Panagrellus redivivus TaxID=6233 RepID=A0A7E4VAQ6_PANRE